MVSGMKDAVLWHESIAQRFDSRYQRGARFRERYRVFQDILARYGRPEFEALDFGCGSGVFTELMARQMKKVTAVDGSRTMLHLARQRTGGREAVNTQYMEARLEDFITGHNEPVDFVLCSSVIEYIDDSDKLLRDCYGILKPGGLLVISMPNGSSLYRRVESLAFRLLGLPRYRRYVRRVETPAESRERLQNAGFFILESQPFGAVAVLSPVLRHLGLARLADTMVVFVARRGVPRFAQA